MNFNTAARSISEVGGGDAVNVSNTHSMHGNSTVQGAETSLISTTTNTINVNPGLGHTNKVYANTHVQPDIEPSPIIEFDVAENEFVKVHRTSCAPMPIFPFSCYPWADLRTESCKFGLGSKRGCLVKSWQLGKKKNRDIFSSSSLLKMPDRTTLPVPPDKIRHGIFVVDTKLIKCFNPTCSTRNKDGLACSTTFHYCCYVKMIASKGISHLYYEHDNDELREDQMEELNKIGMEKVKSSKVILPVCSKSCYNSVIRNRKNKQKETSQKKITSSTVTKKAKDGFVRWDSDGGDGKLSSEEIIVQWLTTNENADLYFGGVVGKKRNTVGTTKETYHNRLSNAILKENGFSTRDRGPLTDYGSTPINPFWAIKISASAFSMQPTGNWSSINFLEVTTAA